MTRPWSIERRLLHWSAGTAIAMSLVYAVATVWIVGSSLHRELDVLAVEEAEEIVSQLRGRRLARAELETALRTIADDHAGYRFAWRVWVPGAPVPAISVGNPEAVNLPTSWDAAQRLDEAPARAFRWHTVEVEASLVEAPRAKRLHIGMLIDASPRRRAARTSTGLVLGAVALSALTAFIAGLLVTRSAGRTLREAAARARDLDVLRGGSPLVGSDAPVEVQAVAEAFRASLAELRQQHSTNLLLTAGMAHELRSPLQNMMGETSVALLRDRTPEEYREVLESQLDEMHDLRRTVDNLITLTALREGGALERLERVQLGAEAELRLAKEAAAAERRGIIFEIEREGDLELDGDREALMLMVRNIVDNAIRCAPDGGRVDVLLAGDPDGITVRVDDDGPGVPADQRDSIFHAFEQSHTRDGARGSYGLGLALARAAAETHGGTIHVEDSPLGGARFEVRLPRAA